MSKACRVSSVSARHSQAQDVSNPGRAGCRVDTEQQAGTQGPPPQSMQQLQGNGDPGPSCSTQQPSSPLPATCSALAPPQEPAGLHRQATSGVDSEQQQQQPWVRPPLGAQPGHSSSQQPLPSQQPDDEAAPPLGNLMAEVDAAAVEDAWTHVFEQQGSALPYKEGREKQPHPTAAQHAATWAADPLASLTPDQQRQWKAFHQLPEVRPRCDCAVDRPGEGKRDKPCAKPASMHSTS